MKVTTNLTLSIILVDINFKNHSPCVKAPLSRKVVRHKTGWCFSRLAYNPAIKLIKLDTIKKK